MKIGTLLTAAIVSLSAVGGGLAIYVAVTKHETMDKVSEAQARLQIVRTLGDSGSVTIVVIDRWTGRIQRAAYDEGGKLHVSDVYVPF